MYVTVGPARRGLVDASSVLGTKEADCLDLVRSLHVKTTATVGVTVIQKLGNVAAKWDMVVTLALRKVALV